MTLHARARANGYNHAIALFVCLGSFTQGFNSVVLGSVIGLSSFSSYMKFDPESTHGASIIDASNGVWTAAAFIGCWLVHWLSDRLGRRLAIQIISALCIISAAIQTGSVNIAMFLVGRTLNGLACGMINSTVPTYISEISPAAQRGRLVGFHGALSAVAYGTVGWCGLGTYFEKDPQIQWRLFIGLQMCAPLLLLAGSPLLPESPRWLINRGRDGEGLRILEKLHNHPSDPSHIGAREEFVQIQSQIALEQKSPTGNIFQLLMGQRYRKRLLMGFLLQLMDQTTGILVVSNYMVIELAKLGVSGWMPLLILGIYNTWAAILNTFNALVVDRIGRIRAISIGISGCIVCISVVTGLVANFGTGATTNRNGAVAAIVFMYLFVTSYASSVDASTYVYCSEIFPTHIRAQGVGFSTSGVFLMNTILLTSAGTAFKNIGWRFYLVFIIIPALSVPLIFWYYPETKGLSLEEIGALFGDTVAVDITHLSEKERAELDKTIELQLPELIEDSAHNEQDRIDEEAMTKSN